MELHNYLPNSLPRKAHPPPPPCSTTATTINNCADTSFMTHSIYKNVFPFRYDKEAEYYKEVVRSKQREILKEKLLEVIPRNSSPLILTLAFAHHCFCRCRKYSNTTADGYFLLSVVTYTIRRLETMD